MGPYLAKKCKEEFYELKFFSTIGTFSKETQIEVNAWIELLRMEKFPKYEVELNRLNLVKATAERSRTNNVTLHSLCEL